MSITSDTIFGKTLLDSVNSVFQTAAKPPPPPKQKTTFGLTHYTCLPSKSTPAEYECVKGYDETIDDNRYHGNLVTQLLVRGPNSTLRHIYADEAPRRVLPEFMNDEYYVCYPAEDGDVECKKGQFDSALEEGKVKYISVPALLPSHEWYIKKRWPNMRVVDKFSDWKTQTTDLNPKTTLQ